MFDNRDDPEHLMRSVELFLGQWHGSLRSWFGTSPEKLADAVIPDPLRLLYAFAANCPGKNAWCSALSNQDHLCPFELLQIKDGRLLFAWENQCVWYCGTLSEGADPPVWLRFDDGPWQPLCDSLAQFLVTLCLQETVFGSAHVASRSKNFAQNGLVRYFSENGRHVSPVWLDGPYATTLNDNGRALKSFHLIDGKLFIMDDRWCGTNDDDLARSLPDLFRAAPQLPPEFQKEGPIWENTAFPPTVRRHHLESLARRDEEHARFHANRAQSYRKLISSISGEQRLDG